MPAGFFGDPFEFYPDFNRSVFETNSIELKKVVPNTLQSLNLQALSTPTPFGFFEKLLPTPFGFFEKLLLLLTTRGGGGIRTPGAGFSPHSRFRVGPLRPLGHSSCDILS